MRRRRDIRLPRLGRKPKVDRARYPCTYTGPETQWGLQPGTPCRIVANRAGGKRIETPDGKVWTVGVQHVQRAQQPA